MTNTQKLLDKALKKCIPQSWYRLSKETGISATTLSRCMKHDTTLDNEAAVKLADFLEIDRMETIAYIEQDRAPEEKKAWWAQQIRHALTILVALATLALLGLFPARSEAYA